MNISEFLEKASHLKIAVIGDYIQDNYIIGTVSRISPEAPVPVLLMEEEKSCSGGAGNVANNLMSLGVNTLFYFNPDRKSIKTRVMAGGHHMLRIDEEAKYPSWDNYEDSEWRDSFESMLETFDCVILSDYHKGVVSESVAKNVIKLCFDKKIPVVADAKRDYEKFAHATIIKCNHKEWKEYSDLEDVNRNEFCHGYDIRNFVITHGDKGITASSNKEEDDIHEGGINVNIVDVCGAGDTVTAILGITEALKIPIENAIELANVAAAEVCRHPGVYPIEEKDLIKWILDL